VKETRFDEPVQLVTSPRPSYERWQRVLDTALGVIAAGVCVLLLSTACPTSTGAPPDSQVDVDLQLGAQQQNVTHPTTLLTQLTSDDPAGLAKGGGTITSSTLGGGFASVVADVDGADATASTTVDLQICFEATHTTNADLFLSNSFKIEKDCQGGATAADYLTIDTDVWTQKNDETQLLVYQGSASASCSAETITSAGFAAWIESIPGFRYFSGHSPQFPDSMSVVPGDNVTVMMSMTLESHLPEDGSGSIELDGAQSFTYDFGFQKKSCAVAECSTSADCPSGRYCDLASDVCRSSSFASEPLNLTPNSASLTQGVQSSVSFSFKLYPFDLRLYRLTVTDATGGLVWNGVAANNQIVGGCSAGPLNLQVLTTLDADQLYIPLDGNGTFNPGQDVSIAVNDSGALLEIEIDVPNANPTALTIPTDVTLTCQGFFGMFEAGTKGNHDLEVEATSVDPDTAGANNAAGLPPLHKSLMYVFNVDGEPLCESGGASLGAPVLVPSYDADSNGSVRALQDGIVIARYLFGVTGSALVANALGAGATRPDPAVVAEYLECLETTMLDVDDNDLFEGAFDGVLILRHLLGFSGDALVSGALGAGAMRDDPGEIGDFIDQFAP